MFYEMIGFLHESEEPALHCLPDIDPAETAFFLDFDGVLVELAETPDGIEVPGHLAKLLNGLSEAAGGAVAIVSGRAARDIRRHLPGWQGIVVGSHGGEIDRAPGGEPEALVEVDAGTVAAITRMVDGFAASDPAYIAEPKPTGVVLHFRRNPDLRSAAWSMLDHTLNQFPGFHIHHSKMAFEVRPDGIGKEHAIARLAENAPFAGRKPIVFGDDVTDEPAMGWANEHGGHSVKVGDGQSCGRCRLPSVRAVHHALARLVEGKPPERYVEPAQGAA